MQTCFLTSGPIPHKTFHAQRRDIGLIIHVPCKMDGIDNPTSFECEFLKSSVMLYEGFSPRVLYIIILRPL